MVVKDSIFIMYEKNQAEDYEMLAGGCHMEETDTLLFCSSNKIKWKKITLKKTKHTISRGI